MDETAPVGTLTLEQVQEAEQRTPSDDGVIAQDYGEMYGPLKALCEQAASETMPGRVLTIRPGLIVGPYDYSDRFTYWPHQVAQGGKVLAPGRPERPIQYIDARALAEWIIQMIEREQNGVYHATQPASHLTMQQVVEACKTVSGSDATFTWLSDSFLLEQGVQPWSQLPLWLPKEEDSAGFLSLNMQKALSAGLTFRPVETTVRETLLWDTHRSPQEKLNAGLDPEQEKRVLHAWHHR